MKELILERLQEKGYIEEGDINYKMSDFIRENSLQRDNLDVFIFDILLQYDIDWDNMGTTLLSMSNNGVVFSMPIIGESLIHRIFIEKINTIKESENHFYTYKLSLDKENNFEVQVRILNDDSKYLNSFEGIKKELDVVLKNLQNSYKRFSKSKFKKILIAIY